MVWIFSRVAWSLLFVALIAIPLPARADSEFIKLSRSPGSCTGGEASKEAKFWFSGETLTIGMEEQAATSDKVLAYKEIALSRQTQDRNLFAKAAAREREANQKLSSSLEARFMLADTALAAGCFKLADEGYRAILTSRTKPEDQAARDRAKVGIDDVRAKQPR